jgi:hypothetical protein
MLGRRRPEQDDSARDVLDRAVSMLRQYQRAGMPALPVEEVLAMLGAGPETVPVPQAPPPRDPQADPLTGARWAGPPGSAPPESS